jgi:hypothetical protein
MADRYIRELVPVLLIALAGAMGCGSNARPLAVADPTRPTPPLRGRPSVPLFVIPLDSLRTLATDTPVEIVLRSGASVLGTSFQPQPDPDAEFHMHAAPRRMFEPRDTVRIPITGIEVAVSTVPLVSGSPTYAGPRRLRPLPRAGEPFDAPVRPMILALTIAAVGGAIALLGTMAIQETR